jgi:membrane protease YdiL (CAAX protease family)
MIESIQQYFLSILIIGVPWALAIGFFLNAKTRFWIFGPQRQRAKPWGGLEILAILFITQIVWSVLLFAVIERSKALDQFYGPGFSEANRHDKQPEDPGLTRSRISLWVSVLTFPLNIATILLIPMLVHKVQFYQLGLSRYRWTWNLAAGTLFFVAITPPVYTVNYAADRLITEVNQKGPTRHPFDEIPQHAHSKAEWILIGFAVLVVAPIYEEMFFRGILQGWLAKKTWGGLGAFLLAIFLSILIPWNSIQSALNNYDWADLAHQLQPLGFVLAIGPALLVIPNLGNPKNAGAIFGSSLLFAIAHTSVWPSPIPLFFLGLGLGWLAHRSQSLAGPIVVHSLFNLVGFLGMIFRPSIS